MFFLSFFFNFLLLLLAAADRVDMITRTIITLSTPFLLFFVKESYVVLVA
jgi:hypothetical protein